MNCHQLQYDGGQWLHLMKNLDSTDYCNSFNLLKTSLECFGIWLSTSVNTHLTIFLSSIMYVCRLENVPKPGTDRAVP